MVAAVMNIHVLLHTLIFFIVEKGKGKNADLVRPSAWCGVGRNLVLPLGDIIMCFFIRYSLFQHNGCQSLCRYYGFRSFKGKTV